MLKAGVVSVALLSVILAGANYAAPLIGPAIALAAALLGGLASWLLAAPRMHALRQDADMLRRDLEQDSTELSRLRSLERNVTSLRHDLRGILSPALLTADRLLENESPAMRRVAEVVIRTVDRATARLSETKLGGPESASKAAPLERPDPVD